MVDLSKVRRAGMTYHAIPTRSFLKARQVEWSEPLKKIDSVLDAIPNKLSQK